MAATGTVELSAEVKAAYSKDYYIAGQNSVYFDQLAYLKEVEGGQKGISYNWPMIESLQPQPTAISEYADVTPQRMTGNELSVTLQEFGSAVEVTRFVSATSYADVYEQAALVNGYSMAESVDLVARATLGQGGRQFRQNNRATRSLYDGIATAADRITPQWLELLTVYARSLKMPLYDDGTVLAMIHPFVFYDLLQNTGIRDLAIRTNPEILFNGELAYWSGIRICVSNNAKAFYGAGATRASSLVTTLAAPVSPGDTNIKLVSVTNLTVGQWIAIKDADEPGNIWSDTNEYFYVTAVGTAGAAGTGVDGFAFDPGPGDGGGVRFSHPTGTVVNNNSSVYPVCVVGPQSLTKAASDVTGEYGMTVVSGPFDRLGRFISLGWYLIAGYTRTRSSWLLRGECSSSVG